MRGQSPKKRRSFSAIRNRRRLQLENLEARRVLDASAVLGDWFANEPTPSEYQPNQLLFAMNDSRQAPPILAIPNVSLISTSQAGLYQVTNPSAAVAQQVEAILAADPAVRYVEPVYEYTTQTEDQLFPDDANFNQLYGMHNTGQSGGVVDADIDAPEAWFHIHDASNVVIADIDTGVDYTHPDLYLNIWINQDEIPAERRVNLVDVDNDGVITFRDLNYADSEGVFVNQGAGKITDLNGTGYIDGGDLLKPTVLPGGEQGGWADGLLSAENDSFLDDLVGWDFVNNDNDPMDDHNHGTHTTGTIAGIGDNGIGVAGVAWEAQVMVMKFLSASGSGSSLGAAQSVAYAADNGAVLSSNSWGGGGASQTLANAISYAADTAGHLFVAAAGNNGRNTDTAPFYPAGYDLPNVLAVASTTRTDAMSGFSNYGVASVDLAAPGSAIRSTVVGGYATFSGTSMATPHVAGAAALVYASQPEWSYAEVKARLMETVDPIPSLAGKVATGGRLNVHNAVYTPSDPPPADPTDIVVADVLLAGAQAIVSYEIVAANSDAFELSLVLSEDGSAIDAEVLGSILVSEPEDLAVGAHSIALPLGEGAGAIPLPGLGVAETDGQYYLLAVADITDQVAESDDTPLEDNVAMAKGAYLGSAGIVYVIGTPENDELRVTNSSGNVVATVNGASTNFAAGSVASIRVRGNAGNDDINGAGANASIWASGGDGADAINGGNAADTILGDGGADELRFLGDNANNQITLLGASGGRVQTILNGVRDTYYPDSTDTYLIDGAGGNDRITVRTNFNYPAATLIGGTGNDVIVGGKGNDLILGGAGNDTMNGGDGLNVLVGGEGAKDRATVAGTNGADHLTVTFEDGSIQGKRLNGSGVAIAQSSISETEQLTLSGLNGNDFLDASGLDVGAANLAALILRGGNNDDILHGSEGPDTLNGDNGVDQLFGFGGNDKLNGGNDNDALHGGAGNDTLNGNSGDDEIFGDAGTDSVFFAGSQTADEIVLSGAGVVTVAMGPRGGVATEVDTIHDIDRLTLSGRNGNDLLDASAFSNAARSAIGLQTLSLAGGNNNDDIHGSPGADKINGGNGNDMLFGYAGNDNINGAQGDDEISGGDGNDVLTAGSGDDLVWGDAGNDRIVGTSGQNVLVGNAGDDTLIASTADPNILIGGVGRDRLTGRGAERPLDRWKHRP